MLSLILPISYLPVAGYILKLLLVQDITLLKSVSGLIVALVNLLLHLNPLQSPYEYTETGIIGAIISSTVKYLYTLVTGLVTVFVKSIENIHFEGSLITYNILLLVIAKPFKSLIFLDKLNGEELIV